MYAPRIAVTRDHGVLRVHTASREPFEASPRPRGELRRVETPRMLDLRARTVVVERPEMTKMIHGGLPRHDEAPGPTFLHIVPIEAAGAVLRKVLDEFSRHDGARVADGIFPAEERTAGPPHAVIRAVIE